MWLLVIAIVGLLLLWLFLKWTRVRNYWAERGVPYEPPHPLLGSLTFLQKENPSVWAKNLYIRFNRPYVGIWLFWRPALVINCPEIAQRVLVKDFDVFRNRLLGTGSYKADPFGGLNIFMLNDPMWSSMRRPITAMFTSSKLKSLHNVYNKKSKDLVQRINNSIENKQELELKTMFADFTTDLISIAAFGVDDNATLTGDGPMRSITKDFMKFSLYRSIGWCAIFFFPELVEIFRFKMFPKSAEDFFKRVFRQVVAERGGYNGEYSINDLMDILRRMKYEADKNGEVMDETLLVAQAMIMLQGGFDTTSGILSFILYELAYNAPAQEKLYNELINTKKMYGDKELDGTVLGEMVYMNCVIKEALRKYTSMGWLDRICDTDYRIDDNLVIPKGTTVYVNAIGMHWDPNIYPDPEKFYPERFLEENGEKKPFMPFGEGPRSCIGRRFAYRTIWYALSHIVMNFQLQPIPGSKRPNEIEADKRGLFLNPGEDLFITFVPRI